MSADTFRKGGRGSLSKAGWILFLLCRDGVNAGTVSRLSASDEGRIVAAAVRNRSVFCTVRE